MANVAEQVKAIIVEKLGVDAAEVVESASFTNDLGADSLDVVELVMDFEKAFDIQISDEVNLEIDRSAFFHFFMRDQTVFVG